MSQNKKSDGSTADYYELPEGANELQDIISYKDMNAQIGEIFRACMRYGEVDHSPKIRDIKKIIFYANEELRRIEKYETVKEPIYWDNPIPDYVPPARYGTFLSD